MSSKDTLTGHRDIQAWVAKHHGLPALRRTPNQYGEMRARLALKFRRPRPAAPTSTPTQDDGISPVSWSAWLAELDRQNLALKVADSNQPAFEFVERKRFN